MMLTRITLLFILSLSSVLFYGCDKDYYPDENEPKGETVVPPPPFKYLPFHKTIPYEDLNDSKFYQEDRVQFMWTPEGEKMQALWSMKLDGTDVRKVVDSQKLFFGNTWTFLHTPVRSPNRRYLAYLNLADELFSGKVIYDLKTGERIKLIQGGSAPHYCWSPDNRYLFFYNNFKMYRYDMQKRELKQTPETIWSHGLYTLEDGKTILAVDREGVSYYDYDGRLIEKKEFELDHNQRNFHYVTKDGKLAMFKSGKEGVIVSLKNEPKIIKIFDLPKRFKVDFVLFDDGKKSIVTYGDKIEIYTVGEDSNPILTGNGYGLTMFNYLHAHQ